MVNTSSSGGGNGGHGPAPDPDEWAEGADQFVDRERLRLAAQRRRRARWRHDRRHDEASIVSVLRAAVGQRVTVHSASGATSRGVVVEVGDDLVELERHGLGEGAGGCWLSLGAVVAVELDGAPGDDAAHTGGRRLAEVLEDLRGVDRLVLGLTSGAVLSGTLVGNGSVVTLRAEDGTHAVVEPATIESVTR